MVPESREITRLLERLRTGDRSAETELISLIQADLRRIAHSLINRESPGITLQATVLVDDVLMKLLYGGSVDWQDRAHFFAAAARQMRFILIDHARTIKAQKRVPSSKRLPLDAVTLIADGRQQDVIEIDEALSRFAVEYPDPARVVEMRVFGGYSIEEIAGILGVSDRTVKRYWKFARAWFHRALRPGMSEAASTSTSAQVRRLVRPDVHAEDSEQTIE